ncbi:hypothetical protein D3C84_1139190 [compost metagenome]
MRKRIAESTFCYAKEGGQGFINKSKCTCDKETNPCQAIIDRDRFLEAFEDMEHSDSKRRSEIIKEIKSEFKDSKWFKDNVIE